MHQRSGFGVEGASLQKPCKLQTSFEESQSLAGASLS